MEDNSPNEDDRFIDVEFYVETNPHSVLAVFPQLHDHKDNRAYCYSLLDGHCQGSISYLKSLRRATLEEAKQVTSVLEETYGYLVHYANPF